MQVVVCIQLWIFKGRRSKRRPTNSLHASLAFSSNYLHLRLSLTSWICFQPFPERTNGVSWCKGRGAGQGSLLLQKALSEKVGLLTQHQSFFIKHKNVKEQNRKEQTKMKERNKRMKEVFTKNRSTHCLNVCAFSTHNQRLHICFFKNEHSRPVFA